MWSRDGEVPSEKFTTQRPHDAPELPEADVRLGRVQAARIARGLNIISRAATGFLLLGIVVGVGMSIVHWTVPRPAVRGPEEPLRDIILGLSVFALDLGVLFAWSATLAGEWTCLRAASGRRGFLVAAIILDSVILAWGLLLHCTAGVASDLVWRFQGWVILTTLLLVYAKWLCFLLWLLGGSMRADLRRIVVAGAIAVHVWMLAALGFLLVESLRFVGGIRWFTGRYSTVALITLGLSGFVPLFFYVTLLRREVKRAEGAVTNEDLAL